MAARKSYDYAKELSQDTIGETLKQLLFKSMEVEPVKEYIMLTIPSGFDELVFSEPEISYYSPKKYNSVNTLDGAHRWSIYGEHPVHKTTVAIDLTRDIEYDNSSGTYKFLEKICYGIQIESSELSELYIRCHFRFDRMGLIKPKRRDKFIESLYDSFKAAHTAQSALDDYKEYYLDIKTNLAKIYATCRKYV